MSNHGTTRHHTCGRGFTLTLHAHDLHWLPIHQRITYKLCTIVYKCLHGVAPSYLTEMSVPVAANTGRRCLRSAARGELMVPRTRTITYGSRSFAVSGPRVWNDLPPTLHASSTTLGQFQSRLKTTLFRLAYGMWLGAFVTVYEVRIAPYKCSNLLTYLLTYFTRCVRKFRQWRLTDARHSALSNQCGAFMCATSLLWGTGRGLLLLNVIVGVQQSVVWPRRKIQYNTAVDTIITIPSPCRPSPLDDRVPRPRRRMRSVHSRKVRGRWTRSGSDRSGVGLCTKLPRRASATTTTTNDKNRTTRYTAERVGFLLSVINNLIHCQSQNCMLTDYWY